MCAAGGSTLCPALASNMQHEIILRIQIFWDVTVGYPMSDSWHITFKAATIFRTSQATHLRTQCHGTSQATHLRTQCHRTSQATHLRTQCHRTSQATHLRTQCHILHNTAVIIWTPARKCHLATASLVLAICSSHAFSCLPDNTVT
jgi:hypothetical protein